ncbi:MAG: hypothetical protein LBD41_05595 [Clostridiales Family XIII bacterium]|jgi:hypothetical protein|nr:hypothetical protein [Clostridiales Family XIII bacterium]
MSKKVLSLAKIHFVIVVLLFALIFSPVFTDKSFAKSKKIAIKTLIKGEKYKSVSGIGHYIKKYKGKNGFFTIYLYGKPYYGSPYKKVSKNAKIKIKKTAGVAVVKDTKHLYAYYIISPKKVTIKSILEQMKFKLNTTQYTGLGDFLNYINGKKLKQKHYLNIKINGKDSMVGLADTLKKGSKLLIKETPY